MEKYKSLRDSVIFQLKFDFGILLVLGAVISYLKLERNEIFQTTSEIKFFIIGISFLILFGLNLERIVSLFLVGNDNNAKENKDLKIIKMMMLFQFILNVLLVSGMTSFSFGWLETHLSYKNNTELTYYLKNKVQTYLTSHGCLPKNDTELLGFDSTIAFEMNRLDISEFKILPIKDPVNETNLNAQFDAKLLSLIKEELSKRKIKFNKDQNRLDFFVYKYFDVFKKVTEKPITIEFPFEYQIIMPGYDNKIGTDDDIINIVPGIYAPQRQFIRG